MAAKLAAVAEPPQCPEDLNADEAAVWDTIIASRSNAEWETGVDLLLAAQLARMLVLMRNEMEEVVTEGTIIQNPRGVVPNPRVTALLSIQTGVLRLQARLRLSLTDEMSDDEGLLAGRREQRVAQKVSQVADAEEDGLIPRLIPAAVQPSARTPSRVGP